VNIVRIRVIVASKSMSENNKREIPRQPQGGMGWGLSGAGLACLGLGALWGEPLSAAIGAVALCLGLFLLGRQRASTATSANTLDEADARPAPRPIPAGGHQAASDPDDVNTLVDRMLAQYRFALLLRPQIAKSLRPDQFARAKEALRGDMALVPDGDVALGCIDEALDDGVLDEEEMRVHEGRVVRVQRFFLDRYSVTNRQYFEFVAAEGYRQMGLWDQSILPAMLDFVDLTGEPGPRFWKHGCYLEGREDHPVVGVSWHEAAAYARWVGKRLPIDVEWVKAGSWPVPISETQRSQRRYPWGETMDRSRANLWGSGPERTVSVREYADGVSVGGVHQLIGNVWEWTNGNFRGVAGLVGELAFESPMKSLRGGAFDTYFDSQATCQFQSGDSPLARKRNIGFRLAVGVCDLLLAQPSDASGTSAEDELGDQDAIAAEAASEAEEVHA
jgi:gamma-glutamyl hercynylcysteine S-oxide synthase